jgi:hypothetical protein
MSVQFQASVKTRKEKLDFIQDKFSAVADKEGDAEYMILEGDEAVYRTGGFTHFGTLDRTQKGADVFIPKCDISNLQDDGKIDQIYQKVVNKSKGQDDFNPFLPILDDLPKKDDDEEPILEPFKPFK